MVGMDEHSTCALITKQGSEAKVQGQERRKGFATKQNNHEPPTLRKVSPVFSVRVIQQASISGWRSFLVEQSFVSFNEQAATTTTVV